MKRAYLKLFFIFIFVVMVSISGCSEKSVIVHYRIIKNAKIEYHEGIPFLYLKGTDYEVGYQYGFLLKDILKTSTDESLLMVDKDLQQYISEQKGFVKLFFNLFGKGFMKKSINKALKDLPPDYREQIQGISDGSGIPIYNIIALTLIADIACSSLIIVEDNQVIHGRNFDWSNFAGKYPVVVNYDIDGKIKYTNFGFVPLLFMVSGINEEGISFSINALPGTQPTKKKDKDSFLFQHKILDSCKTLSDVDKVLDGYIIPVNHVLIIASQKEKKGAFYECLGETIIRTDFTGSKYVGNDVTADEAKKFESIENHFFRFREDTAELLLDKLKDKDPVERAIDILSSTQIYNYGDVEFHVSINNGGTIQSIVFDAANSNVYFAVSTGYAGWDKWIKYNYETEDVSVYRQPNPIRNNITIKKQIELMDISLKTDWQDNESKKKLIKEIEKSGVETFWSLRVCSYISRDIGRFDEAEKYVKKWIEKYPDIGWAYYLYGNLLQKMNRNEEAIKILEQGLNTKFLDDYMEVIMYYQLIKIYEKRNDKEKVKIYKQKALEIHKPYWMPKHIKKEVQKLKN
ncbi:hypothetical protein KAU33_05420 [Candidatus Dependentiae bacterium]|nr:hypothetical protein [Candidatus Dependentiae bacterium]